LGFLNKKFRAATLLTIDDSLFGLLDQKGYEGSVVESDKNRIKVKYQIITIETYDVHLKYIIRGWCNCLPRKNVKTKFLLQETLI
jgi:hypothetical protein